MSLTEYYKKNKDVIGIDIELLNDKQKKNYEKFLEQFNIANNTPDCCRTELQNDLIVIFPKIADFINLCHKENNTEILKDSFSQINPEDRKNSNKLAMHIIATLTDKCHDIVMIEKQGIGDFNVPREFKKIGKIIDRFCENDEMKRKNVSSVLYKTVVPDKEMISTYIELNDFYGRMDYKHDKNYHRDDYLNCIRGMVKQYSPIDEYVGAPSNKKEMLNVVNYLFNEVLVYPVQDENGERKLLSPKKDMEYILNDETVKKLIDNVIPEQENIIKNNEQCI